MAYYYADSSALVKRHVREAGTDWFRVLADPATGNVMITARLSLIEVYSALNRTREAHLPAVDYAQIAADFAAICTAEYELVELTPPVVERARRRLERHPLRAYDAMHLASALLTQTELEANRLPSLIFLTADDRLLDVAQAEGMKTDNPNRHP